METPPKALAFVLANHVLILMVEFKISKFNAGLNVFCYSIMFVIQRQAVALPISSTKKYIYENWI